jgi:hypothetical protein
LTYQKVVKGGMLKVRTTFGNLRYLTIFVETKKETMTPKEKAKELIDKFTVHTKVFHQEIGWEEYMDSAKQCAMIAVDEILGMSYFDVTTMSEEDSLYRNYWTEVRAEIGAIE